MTSAHPTSPTAPGAASEAAAQGAARPAQSLGEVQGDVTQGGIAPDVGERIEGADGFAGVFPEHKYAIVKALQGTAPHELGALHRHSGPRSAARRV